MAVPRNKSELLQQSEDNYRKLIALVESYPDDEKTSVFPEGTMNRNICDVLAHLHHWHLMFLAWYKVGMKGGKPEMPAKGYEWKDTKELNRSIWEQYRNHKLDVVIQLLEETHEQVHSIIEKHSDEELFEKKRYHWTGSSSLGTYLRSSTSSHYVWAYNLIKKAKKN